MTVTFLHSFISCEDSFSQIFSGLKLGVQSSIDLCAAEMEAKIKKQIKSIELKEFVITCCPSPMNQYSARYVSVLVAKKLGIPFICLQRKLPQKAKNYNYYYSMGESGRTKLLRESLICPKRKFKGKKVILIDDAYSTGAAIKSSAKILRENGAAKVFSFVYLKLPKRRVGIEAEVAECLFAKHGLNFLISIANNKNNRLAPRFLFIVFNLPRDQLNILLNSINADRKHNLLRGLKKYAR